MYSKTVILKAISSYFSCHSFRKAALKTSIPKSTLHFWVSKLRSFFENGIKKRHVLRKRTRKREQFYLLVSHELQKHPFHTLKTLRDALPPSLSLSSIARIIQDLGFSRKKATWKICPRNTTHEIHLFKHYLKNSRHTSLVSIDETGFCTSQLPLMGYSKVGERLRATKTQNRRYRFSCAMAIDNHGIGASELRRRETKRPYFFQVVYLIRINT